MKQSSSLRFKIYLVVHLAKMKHGINGLRTYPTFLNKLNMKLQGRETHVLFFQDSLEAFVSKLHNWRRETNLGNIAMLEKLCGVTDECQIQLDRFLNDEITEHLQSLEKEVECYFPELSKEQKALVRSPFCTELMTLHLVISSRLSP